MATNLQFTSSYDIRRFVTVERRHLCR